MFKRIRFSRKFVLIGGVFLLLGGASGIAAVFVGKERLFGTPHVSANGLECNTVQTVNIKKNGSLWIRKFIRIKDGDGPERVKTALRVAKAVYDKQKPDLVQVSVLDQNGPDLRSNMRGRAIAAQAVFIPDVKKLPDGADAQTFSAFYYDGAPNSDGLFYGLRIDLPLEDSQAISAALTDFTDCAEPVSETAPAGHGAPAKGHDKPSGGHGEAAPSHDAPAAEHGKETPEAAQEGAHGSEPSSADAPPVTEDPQLLTSTPEHDSVSIFSFAYIKALIFGKGSTTAVAAEPSDKPVAEEPAAHGAEEPKSGH